MVPDRICDPGDSRRLTRDCPLYLALVDRPRGGLRLIRLTPSDILETCLYAEDLEAAEEFYSNVLGLTPFAKVDGRHIFFRCGRGVFLVFNPAKTELPDGDVPTHGTRGAGHVAFRIEDGEFDRWRQHLTQLEVRIEKVVAWPGDGRSLYFRDPAGNSLELATPGTWGFDLK